MRGPPNHHSSPPKIMCVPGMWPTMAGPAPWPTSQQMVKDWGATMRPKALFAATSSSKWRGFGYCMAWTQRRMSVTVTGSFSWPPPTGLPMWRSTSDVSKSMASFTWVMAPPWSLANPDTRVSPLPGVPDWGGGGHGS